jgi:hypothetical protein
MLAGMPVGSVEMRDRLYLLDDEHYCTYDMAPGDVLLLKHSEGHAGTACPSDATQPRIVLFDMITRQPRGVHAEEQYVWWLFVRDAYGGGLTQPYRAALRRAAAAGHRPLSHEPDRHLARIHAQWSELTAELEQLRRKHFTEQAFSSK